MTSPSTIPPSMSDATLQRSVRIYERLLVLYPRQFRSDYGPDMVQAFSDIVTHMADGQPRRVWPRILGDLVSSATRQQLAQLRPSRRQPSWSRIVLAVLALAAVPIMFGGGSGPIGLVVAVLMAGPPIGIVLIRRAWVKWRATGARSVVLTLLGLACMSPWVWLLRDGDRYWIGVIVVLSLIWGLSLGSIWAVTTLVRARKNRVPGHRRRAIAVISATVIILGGMAAAGFNSYLNSRPPPGDHSPGRASADSRALWEAADQGDLQTVVEMIDACADPFVHFNDGGRARSNAEFWAGVNNSGIGTPVSEPQLGVYLQIIDRLHEAEETWTLRCNS